MIAESQLVPYHASDIPHGSWLVFAPHADDESFGMGGALLRAKALGLRTTLVIMTDGALGGDQEDLVATRQREARAAAEILGISAVHFLAEPDRGLQLSTGLVKKLAELVRAEYPDFAFFPAPFEPHPDHRTTASLVWRALSMIPKASRPTPVSYEITAQSPVNRLVDISMVMAEKVRACSCYGSQLGENNYLAVVAALNQSRTFSLPAEVKYAEGFFHYPVAACERALRDFILDLPILSQESLGAIGPDAIP